MADQYASGKLVHVDDFAKSKTPLMDFDERAHLTPKIAPQVEALAAHPNVVEHVKAEARENGEIVTRQAVCKWTLSRILRRVVRNLTRLALKLKPVDEDKAALG